jgi:ankyrin repeat protein
MLPLARALLQGNLPLHYAAMNGFTEIAVFLTTSHYSTLQVRNSSGKTASDVARDSRRVRLWKPVYDMVRRQSSLFVPI